MKAWIAKVRLPCLREISDLRVQRAYFKGDICGFFNIAKAGFWLDKSPVYIYLYSQTKTDFGIG
jgi:hypothetical protein